MESLDLAYILLTMIAVRCDGFLYTMRYKQLQGDSTLSGITCAMARRESARGVEFDTADDTCTSLGTDWFSSPATQPGHNYLELIELTYHLEQNKRVLTPVPENFRLGDSIVLYLEKEASAVGVVTIQFDLFDGNGVPGRFGPTDYVYMHINNHVEPGKMNFKSFVNGGWTPYQPITDQFHNGTGKIEMVVMATEILKWLKVGGRLLISGYCCSDGEHSEVFKSYAKQRQNTLLSPTTYGMVLEKAGFLNVQADDRTGLFVTSLEKEVVKIESIKTELIQEFNEDDYDYLVNGWKDKLKRTKDQRWGVFNAEKK